MSNNGSVHSLEKKNTRSDHMSAPMAEATAGGAYRRSSPSLSEDAEILEEERVYTSAQVKSLHPKAVDRNEAESDSGIIPQEKKEGDMKQTFNGRLQGSQPWRVIPSTIKIPNASSSTNDRPLKGIASTPIIEGSKNKDSTESKQQQHTNLFQQQVSFQENNATDQQLMASLKSAGIGAVSLSSATLLDTGGPKEGLPEAENDPSALVRPQDVLIARFDSTKSGIVPEELEYNKKQTSEDGALSNQQLLMASLESAGIGAVSLGSASFLDAREPKEGHPEAENDPSTLVRPQDFRIARSELAKYGIASEKLEHDKKHALQGGACGTQPQVPQPDQPVPHPLNESPTTVMTQGSSDFVGAHPVAGISLHSTDSFDDDSENLENTLPFPTRSEDVLVSAQLVQEGPAGDGVLATAEEVSSGLCYIGRQKIKGSTIALCLITVLVVVLGVTIPVELTREVPPIAPHGTCGKGWRGNGICKNGQCCSPFGYCGNTPDHCASSNSADECYPDALENATATVLSMNEDQICGGFYPDFGGTPCVQNIHPNYNLIFLHAAHHRNQFDGSVYFSPPFPYDSRLFRAEVQVERSRRSRKFVLTVGGHGSGFFLPDRSTSQKLVNSLDDIYEEIGGLDGMDWGIFYDGHEVNTAEMIWIGLELKSRYDSGFIVSANVQPGNDAHLEFCRETINSGAVDYCMPQFFNDPGFTQQQIVDETKRWAEDIGEEHVIVSLSVHETEDDIHQQRLEEAIAIYREVKGLFQNISGTTNWSIPKDYEQGNIFATEVCTV